jgi:predicted amidohydrolase
MNERLLNLAIVQMPISPDAGENVDFLAERMEALESEVRRPDLVVGVEYGIAPEEPEPVDGEIMRRLGELAAKHQVALLPGSMKMVAPGEEGFRNAAPFFGPDGSLLGVYDKMVPWDTALEAGTIPGDEYLMVELPGSGARIGVLICFDADFPEIARTLTLMGSEVLIQLSMDPDSIPPQYRDVKVARAIENQAYYVYTCGAGDYGSMHLRGRSLVVGPEGDTVFEAGEAATTSLITLELDRVANARKRGSWHQVAQLEALRQNAPEQPFAGRELESPLFTEYWPE